MILRPFNCLLTATSLLLLSSFSITISNLTPTIDEVNHFFSPRKSDNGYYYLIVDKQHNKKGFSTGKVNHEKKWKEPLFYLYDVPRIIVRFNFNPSKDAPYLAFSVIFIFFSSFLISFEFLRLDKPSQKKLYGASKIRADEVLKIAEEKFNLKTLITEANLKRVGILSERVGTRCEYTKFGNEVSLTASSVVGSDN